MGRVQKENQVPGDLAPLPVVPLQNPYHFRHDQGSCEEGLLPSHRPFKEEPASFCFLPIIDQEIAQKDVGIEKAIYSTRIENLSLIPSGISLQGYFEMDPVKFAEKLMELKADFLLIDVPFPLGEAAFLSLGVCSYFVPILTEDEFVLCVESAIDTIRLGRYLLRCVPAGFVFNRIKTPKKFTGKFIKDLEDLLEIRCISEIREDPKVSKSYGGVESKSAFLAYEELVGSDFVKGIDRIAHFLIDELPTPEKKDPVLLIRQIIAPSPR